MDRIGRYKIVGELGRGAMGVVYHAIDPNIGRPVAIKTIHFGGVRNPEEQKRLRERLFREARSAGILSHPGIVTIYDVEQQGDLAYIAMEFVDGPTLDQVLSEAQPIPPERMFSVLGQTAAALDYAHHKGIVHRDIKPANIMIAKDGTAKITDFGIAKITAPEQLTVTGSIVGTPHYMSPEQVQGQPVDGRSDQFSLAVIAFEMVTGEKPYTGEHLTTVVYKIVAEEPAAPHRLNPTLGVAIESVLRQSLSKKPDLRYPTCQEFTEALEKACAASKGWKTMPRGGSLNEPTMADSAKPVVTLPPARHARRAEATTTSERGERRKAAFLPFLLAILVAAGLLALIGWQAAPWLSNRGPASPGSQAQATKKPEQPPVQPAPPATAPGPTEAKPSPMPPPAATPAEPANAENTPPAGRPLGPEQKPPAEEPAAQPVPKQELAKEPGIHRPPAGPRSAPMAATQPVSIISSPGGATATLDGRPGTACTAPCSLDAAPGRHTISITMPGYQIEHREVDVGSSPVELLPVILRPLGGTLLLASVPEGAAISVDGRRLAQVTPAQIPLSPGTYTITVEKDGKQASATVEIRNGTISHQRIVLEQ
jgi:serine/threonine-protein kinase